MFLSSLMFLHHMHDIFASKGGKEIQGIGIQIDKTGLKFSMRTPARMEAVFVLTHYYGQNRNCEKAHFLARTFFVVAQLIYTIAMARNEQVTCIHIVSIITDRKKFYDTHIFFQRDLSSPSSHNRGEFLGSCYVTVKKTELLRNLLSRSSLSLSLSLSLFLAFIDRKDLCCVGRGGGRFLRVTSSGTSFFFSVSSL